MPYYRGSWYSQNAPFGWFDSGDKPGSNALGVPDEKQGIALPSRNTLGQYFNVTAPNGQTLRLQQTDIGPAKWTGRGVDISAAAGQQFGYSPKTFPTDASFGVEPADGGDMPANATLTSGTSGEGRKMPSLMDLYKPQQPTMESGLNNLMSGGMSNSLIGLGMGLLQPSRPGYGESSWGNALQGLMAGQKSDQSAATARQNAQLQLYDRAYREQEARRAQSNADRLFSLQQRQFDETSWTPGVYEDAGTEQKYPYQQNRRTGETRWLFGQPPGMAGAGTAVGGGAGPGPGTGGGVGYTGTGPLGVGTQAPPGGGFPNATATAQGAPAVEDKPPGYDTWLPSRKKAYNLERDKLMIKQAAAEPEQKAQALEGAGTALRELDAAISQTEKYPGMVAGTFGNLMTNVPGSQATDVAKRLDVVKANIAFDRLQAMRKASPTGGALGSVSDKDMKLLQSSLGSLDQAQTPQQFLEAMRNVRTHYSNVISKIQPSAAGQSQPSEAVGGGGAPRRGFVKGGYVFKGGDPSQQENWAPVR